MAVECLRAGGLVALPTETVYGLAASLDRPDALQRLSRLKERPADSPFPVIVSGLDGPAGLGRVAAQLPGRASELVRRFWPGPLTLVLPAAAGLPPEVVGLDGTVGVRWSPDPALEELIALLGAPVTATSANLRGAPAATDPSQVEQGLGAHLDLLLAGPPRRATLPSTLVRPAADGSLTLLRRGPLPLPLLEQPDRFSLDSLRRGGVPFVQPRGRGLRVTIDPVLLVHFLVDQCGEGPVVDLGTGVGILPLLLASQGWPGPFVGVELQPELALLARENAFLNRLDPARFQVLEGDLRAVGEPLPPGGASWVVTNPPYQALGQGRSSPDPARALACHELGCSLAELAPVARRLLRPGGQLALILPGEREAEALDLLGKADLAPRRLRRVITRAGHPPTRLLLQAEAGGHGPLQEEPALQLYQPGGGYTGEVARYLDGGA